MLSFRVIFVIVVVVPKGWICVNLGHRRKFQIVPRRRQAPGRVPLVGGLAKENFAIGPSALVAAIRTRYDIVEAAVQNHLHAPVHFRARDVTLSDLARHAGVDAGLKLLSGEVSLGERQSTTHVPGDEGYGEGGHRLVEARLLPEQRLEKLDRRPVMHHR